MALRAARFELDCLEQSFPGYTLGQTWNGFACPLFTFEVAAEILSHHEELGYEPVLYDPEFDVFETKDLNAPDDYEPEQWEGQLVEELKLYAIGAYNWVWTEEGQFDE